MNHYKEWWIERYQELSHEIFDMDYWKLDDAQTEILDEAISRESAEYAANLADALRSALKESQ